MKPDDNEARQECTDFYTEYGEEIRRYCWAQPVELFEGDWLCAEHVLIARKHAAARVRFAALAAAERAVLDAAVAWRRVRSAWIVGAATPSDSELIVAVDALTKLREVDGDG